MEHLHHILPNGLTLIGEREESARSLAMGFFVKTGARDEVEAESGVSHFLEHMMFKGTHKRTPEDVNRDFDALGARNNAFTSEEETVYYAAALPDKQRELTELLADMMRPALRNEDFDMEKKVILEEIAMYQDRPISVAFDLLKRHYFGGHPLGQSILGTTQSITDLTRDQMHDYFSRRYAADNLTFVMTGNFDWEVAKAQIEELCGEWQRAGGGREFPPVDYQPQVHLLNTDKFNRAHIVLMGPGLPTQDARRYAASLACEAIGSGDASRLYWALVHPGIAEAAQIGHDAQDGAGSFYGVLVCRPERAQQALDVFRSEVERACADGLSEAEVERAKRRFASSMTLGAETPMGRLRPVAFSWLYRNELLSAAQSLSRVLAVTSEEVNAVLRTRPFAEPTIVSVGPVAELK